MYQLNEIKHVHLEISSKCNASCPLCPRNFYGYPFNDGYVEHNMTLEESKQIFTPEFIKQLNEIYINGNFGDAVMNPHTIDIIEYFRQHAPSLKITMSTNAGARDAQYWEDLARLDVIVRFCIDGLENTHSVYRKNTLYSTVIKNAKTFIAAGGRAIWKMIKFSHNVDQINEAKLISKSMGFKWFSTVDQGRDTGPIFNDNGDLVGLLGAPTETDFNVLFRRRTTDKVVLEDITDTRKPAPITCKVKQKKSIYVSSTGDIFPCCFLGFNPMNYGHGNYHEPANKQLRSLIYKNNALKYGIKNAMQWFDNIQRSWNISTFQEGRLVICNDVCGKCDK